MTKEDILNILITAINDPGAEKSGEYLEAHVVAELKQLVSDNRNSVVQALLEWIKLQKEPQTMLAVNVAKKLNLVELYTPIEILGYDIDNNKVFLPYYRRWINEALNTLAGKSGARIMDIDNKDDY